MRTRAGTELVMRTAVAALRLQRTVVPLAKLRRPPFLITTFP